MSSPLSYDSPRRYEMGDEELVGRKIQPLRAKSKRCLDGVTAQELMTPGVVTTVESAPPRQAFKAMAAYRVQAVLVLAREGGRPLGWVTARGLLAKLEEDAGLGSVRDAITERPIGVAPATTARAVLQELTDGCPGVLVSRMDGTPPEGVITGLDLARLGCEP